MNGKMVIYTAEDGTIQTEVRLEAETIWMTEQQLAVVFDRDRTVIGRHIKNIFKTGELDEKSNVQKMHIPDSDKPVAFYNLDMILSVGYRVNSRRGTQFRIWANRILKEYLVQGYAINEKRLKEQQAQINRLKESIQLVERSLLEQAETVADARGVVRVLAEFANGLGILDDYDHESLETRGKNAQASVVISEQEFMQVVHAMRSEFDSDVFGRPRDMSFSSSVNQIYRSFGGAAFIFGSVAKGEEKATSDVDVCVIGTASFTDVVVALADMNQKLGREINPVVMPYDQFTAKLAAGEQFTTRIMHEPKLFLIGDEHD